MAKIIDIRQQIVEETGELVKEQRRLFTSQFDEEKGYLFWNRKNHSKIYNDIEFPRCFTIADEGRMQRLSRKIYSNTNMLAYRGNGGVRPYTKYQIGDIIELKKSALNEFMKKAIENDVIAEYKSICNGFANIHYYINPIYYFSGKRIPLNLYLIFQKSLDKHLKEWVRNEFNRMSEENNNG